jgi:hypothetical protein
MRHDKTERLSMVANSLVLYGKCAECGSGIGERNIRSVQTFDQGLTMAGDYEGTTISAVITHSAAAGGNLKKLRSILALVRTRRAVSLWSRACSSGDNRFAADSIKAIALKQDGNERG